MKDLIKQILREEIKMKIIITEEQKNKLFIPRKIDERDVEFEKIVKIGSDKFLKDNNIKSLRYIVKADEIWDDLDYADIQNAIRYHGKIILNNDKNFDIKRLYYEIIHSDLLDYSETISSYLSYLITQHNPEDSVLEDLEIEVNSVVGKIKIDGIFTIYKPDENEYGDRVKDTVDKVVNFSKEI